ncbi:MAG: diacylglycerol/lipid kinase family protein [Longimicrobiales bacterium]
MPLAPAIAALLNGHELPVVLNRDACGRGLAELPALLDDVRALGARVSVESVEAGGLAPALRRRVQDGAAILVVGGGDGSVSTAADELAGSTTVLVPLPLGTRNHFAQRYGLVSPAALPLALSAGAVVSLPLGVANGRHFLNNAACGFYPQMVRHRQRMQPWSGQGLATVLAALTALLERPLLDLELDVGGETLERRSAALWVGIGRHSLRLPEPGDTDKDGAVLEIVLPKPVSRGGLLRLGGRLWWRLRGRGKPVDPELETMRARAFTLRTRGTLSIALDGELSECVGPLHFQYREDAVRVLCLVAPEPSAQGAS